MGSSDVAGKALHYGPWDTTGSAQSCFNPHSPIPGKPLLSAPSLKQFPVPDQPLCPAFSVASGSCSVPAGIMFLAFLRITTDNSSSLLNTTSSTDAVASKLVGTHTDSKHQYKTVLPGRLSVQLHRHQPPLLLPLDKQPQEMCQSCRHSQMPTITAHKGGQRFLSTGTTGYYTSHSQPTRTRAVPSGAAPRERRRVQNGRRRQQTRDTDSTRRGRSAAPGRGARRAAGGWGAPGSAARPRPRHRRSLRSAGPPGARCLPPPPGPPPPYLRRARAPRRTARLSRAASASRRRGRTGPPGPVSGAVPGVLRRCLPRVRCPRSAAAVQRPPPPAPPREQRGCAAPTARPARRSLPRPRREKLSRSRRDAPGAARLPCAGGRRLPPQVDGGSPRSALSRVSQVLICALGEGHVSLDPGNDFRMLLSLSLGL